MASYTDADKIMDVDTLIGHVKKLGGYVEEETNNTLVKIEKGHAAVLWQGDKNLGAFFTFCGSTSFRNFVNFEPIKLSFISHKQ